MPSHGMIALIGSGELSDVMAEVHRQLMARLGEPVRPVLIDSPAGFELNVDAINQKAVSYFKRNFNLDLAIAQYRSLKDPVENVAAAVSAIQNANYLFAGPGSPSYALRVWRGSPVWEAVLKRWREGAMLVFASAATLTIGAQTIPVYEIYKVGDDPRWLPGLNLLGELGMNAVVIPHWNNKSGDQHDTRFCFIGAPRYEELQSQLEPNTTILGIDEYTAVLVDDRRRQAEVLGVGEVTVRLNGRQSIYVNGRTFDLDHFNWQTNAVTEQPDPVAVADEPQSVDADLLRVEEGIRSALQSGNLDAIRDGLLALSLIAEAGLEQGILNRASAAVRALQAFLPMLTLAADNDKAAEDERWRLERDTLLDLVVTARTALRSAKLWQVADMLRDRLADLNYTLSDTPQGTTWQR